MQAPSRESSENPGPPSSRQSEQGLPIRAIKAVAIARGYLAPSGIDLVCVPAFVSVEIDGEERTAMRLIVEPR